MRVAAPPTKGACLYGIDTPTEEELIASSNDIDTIRHYIGADSLAYLSIDGLYRAVANVARDSSQPQYCDACFTKDYPINMIDSKDSKELTLLLDVHDERKGGKKVKKAS
jgi:amidophosphoribosyltransferase